jgi:hypothetical protein
MSERSSYLRDQAAKCRSHAIAIGDVLTQTELRKLAAEYIVQAEHIESIPTGTENERYWGEPEAALPRLKRRERP